jgi:phosphoribosylformimino-5-aminoimidazole carboxamide ribotide isomerase
MNGSAVEAILEASGLPVQLGGGIRELATIEGWLAKGVARVVLGTVAARDPSLVEEACRRFEGQIAIGVDARDGRVAVEGWVATADIAVHELARRYEDAGAAVLIHTDIARDGALEGVNVEATAELARAIKTPVIASGGVSSLDDLARLKAVEDAGIVGVISGRALYDGRLDAAQALRLLAGP